MYLALPTNFSYGNQLNADLFFTLGWLVKSVLDTSRLNIGGIIIGLNFFAFSGSNYFTFF